MIAMRGPQSEAAKNDEANGVETDPVLASIAKTRGVDLKKLLRMLKTKPHELTEDEQWKIIEYSSAVIPKALERKMIERYRNDRTKLNELLFLHNTRAATRLATVYNIKYSRTALNRRYRKEDFLAAARYGLWMGATRFDIDRTYKGEPIKFITFATPWIFRYISEMLYEKENMIIHQSLEAKAYHNSNTTFGDLIGEDDCMEDQTNEPSDEDEEKDDEEPQEEELPDLGNEDDILQLSDDEENLGYDTELSQGTLLQSLEDELNTITGPLTDEPDEETVKRQVDACLKVLKEMSSNKRRKDADPEEPKPELNEDAVAAMDRFCTKALKVRDPQERTITLFVGRKYIQAIVKQADGREIPSSIVNANSLLKDIPNNKKRLLECLDLSEDEFNKLCRHYATEYINQGLE